MKKNILVLTFVLIGLVLTLASCQHEHEWTEWNTTKEATCSAEGEQERTCECGEKETKAIEKLAHTEAVDEAVAPTCTETGLTEGKHCSVCEEVIVKQETVAANGHTFGQWTQTLAPTCTEKGGEQRICEVCSFVDTRDIDALGHDHSADWTVDLEPTCTEKGSKSHHCSRCSDKADATEIAANGHAYSAWVVTLAPACTEKGIERRDCDNCDHYETRDIAEAGHSFGAWIETLAPTCTEKGSERRDCDKCDHYETREIDALGHDHSTDWKVDLEPTCTEKGSKSHHCSRCSDKADVTEIAALGHTDAVDAAVAPTCTNTGLTAGKHCSVCDKVLVAQIVVDALGHQFKRIRPNACCETQTVTYECERCDYSYTELLEKISADIDVCYWSYYDYSDRFVQDVIKFNGITGGFGKYSVNITYVNIFGNVYTYAFENIDDLYVYKYLGDCSWSKTFIGKMPKATVYIEIQDEIGFKTSYSIKFPGLSDYYYLDNVNKYTSDVIIDMSVDYLVHTEVITEAVAPTCTNTGLTAGKHCSVCNKVLVAQQTVAALGHTPGAAATCTTNQICTVCNTELVAALGHTDAVDAAVAPTCTNTGLTEGKHCSVCNEVLVAQETVAALGHTDGEWITDKEANCTVDGSKHQVCSVCNATIKTEVISAMGHSYSVTIVNRDCGNNGKKVYTCGACEHFYYEDIPSISLSFRHTSTSSSTVNGYGSYSKGYAVTVTGGYGTILLKYELYTSATATNPTSTIDFTTDTATSVSFRGYSNAIDNYVYKITAKDEAGNISIYRFSLKNESLISYEQKGEVEHTFSDWSVTKESTCSEYGEKQSTCSVCNNTITDIVEKKPHTVVIDKAVPSNCMRTGLTEGSHCSVCEAVIVAQTETPAGEHSYENKTCICGRDVTEDAIATYDLSKNQDKSINGYLVETSEGKKLYILGVGEMKNYSNLGSNITPFYMDKTIKSVYFSNEITTIGSYLLYFCTEMSELKLPNNLLNINSGAICGCNSMVYIAIPNGVTHIGDYAFYGADNLEEVYIPNTVLCIENKAFNSCYKLERIFIPASVTYIGNEVFSSCIRLTIYCEAESQPTGWNSSWNGSSRPVVWGYKAS